MLLYHLLTFDRLAQLVRYTLNLIDGKWTITVSFLKETISKLDNIQ